MLDQPKSREEPCALPNREEAIENYIMGRLSEEEEEKIEVHAYKCDLCFRELQFQDDLKQVVSRMAIPSVFSLRALPWYKGAITSGRAWVRAAAAVLLVAVGLYGSMKFVLPPYFDLAQLSPKDRDGLHLAARSDNSEVQQEFGEAADALLAAESRRLGLWSYFDQTRVEQAIIHLRAAYEMTDDAFAREEQAYFLGKAFLMRASSDSACVWFEHVLATPTRNYESEAASLKQVLGCK